MADHGLVQQNILRQEGRDPEHPQIRTHFHIRKTVKHDRLSPSRPERDPHPDNKTQVLRKQPEPTADSG
jgi:hypothetical protein